MAALAASLCEALLPRAPYRQYVFTHPFPLRWAMLRDRTVLSAVVQRTIRALFAQLRRRARAAGVVDPLPAALTMIQRFGGSLNPHPHGHVVAPDGVFVRDHDTLTFVELPPPSDHDIAALARAVARRVDRWLAQQQADDDDGAYDGDWLQPLLAETQPARRPAWLVAQPIPAPSPRCTEHHGYTVHAQTAVAAHDRPGLEQLLRYGLRGPLAAERLSVLDQGRIVRYRFARPWRNGRTHIDLDPLAFMRRLALLIPPPRQRLLRCHGLFAPRATHRNLLAPLLPQPAQPADGTEPISAPNGG